MDPLSIAASVTAIATLCGRVVIMCTEIAGRKHSIRRTIVSLRTEIVAYQASLYTIQDLLLDQDGVLAQYLGRNEEWAKGFDTALTSCSLTFSILASELQKALDASAGSSWSYALKEQDIKDLTGDLRGQQGAVQLLIQTLQMKSTADILALLNAKRAVLADVRKQADTLSVTWGLDRHGLDSDACDVFSIFSNDDYDKKFDFDEELTKLGPYMRGVQARRQQYERTQDAIPNLIDDDLLDLSLDTPPPGRWTQELQQNFIPIDFDTETLSASRPQSQEHDPVNANESHVDADHPHPFLISLAISLESLTTPPDARGCEFQQPAGTASSELNSIKNEHSSSAAEDSIDQNLGDSELTSSDESEASVDITSMSPPVDIHSTKLLTNRPTNTAQDWNVVWKIPGLLFKPTNINDMIENAPLHYTAFSGDIATMKSILDTPASTNGISHVLHTKFENKHPIHFAAISGNLECVKLLLEYGADIHSMVAWMTALHWAAACGHQKVVRFLLPRLRKRGLACTFRGFLEGKGKTGKLLRQPTTFEGWTPLSLAAYFGHPGIVSDLLKMDFYGWWSDLVPPLHAAVGSVPYLLLSRHSLDNLGVLRARHADLWAFLERDAAEFPRIKGRLETIDILCKSGKFDIDAKNSLGLSAMQVACCAPSTTVVEKLLEHGASVVSRSSPDLSKTDVSLLHRTPGTPIHLAALWNRTTVLQLLLSLDVDPNITAYGGRTPLHDAALMGNILAVKALVDANAILDVLATHAHPSNKATFYSTETPLSLAISQQHSRVVVALIKAGAYIRVPIYRIDSLPSGKKETILHRAVKASDSIRAEALRILLKLGADPNSLDENMRTPLHVLSTRVPGTLDCIKLLFNYGAKANVTDCDGNTPLLFSIIKGSESGNVSEVVNALLQGNADPNLKNKTGQNPLTVAQNLGSKGIFKLGRNGTHQREDYKKVIELLKKAITSK